MRYLIDSHVLLWVLFKPSLLSKKVKDILGDPTNIIHVSAVSYFELSLKYSLGKLELKNFVPEDLLSEAERIGFRNLNLSPAEATGLYLLEFEEHKDPFDKMLFWVAIKNKFKFISRDSRAETYEKQGLEVIW